MPIDFPLNPVTNQVYTSNTKSWIFNGYGWKAYDGYNTVANNVVNLVTASDGQTVFTTPQYVQGQNQIRVLINGLRQNNVSDYTETSPTSITLTSGAVAGDNVVFEVITYSASPQLVNITTVIDDNSSNSTLYPLFTSATSGGLNVADVSTTKLTYNPSTGTLNSANLSINSVDVLDYVITYNLAFG